MTIEDFSQYSQALGVIRAEETMSQMRVADYPQMKEQARNKEWARFKNELQATKPKRALSNKELYEIITKQRSHGSAT